jgi:hypothetical protein
VRDPKFETSSNEKIWKTRDRTSFASGFLDFRFRLFVSAFVSDPSTVLRTGSILRISNLIDGRSVETDSPAYQPQWLFSRRADFWLACGGASIGLLLAILVIFWHGDHELDALDFVLSEFHLGATYDAIIRRRLWRQRHTDVLLIPLIILALTYALSMSGQATLLTSIAMYTAVWHRGRQSFGVARFYQRQVGGPTSRAHDVLLRGAIYLPMLAATLAYTHLAPTEYDGNPYFALSAGAAVTSMVGLAAVVWVIAYLIWIGSRPRTVTYSPGISINSVHPGEWWVVVAHAVAFGSGYVLGASNASYLLVLAVHHEVQYLSFTCAMARRRAHVQSVHSAIDETYSTHVSRVERGLRAEASFIASFLFWPVVGFGGAVFGSWLNLPGLSSLGAGGLFCHYWLDGRIWTRRSLQN